MTMDNYIRTLALIILLCRAEALQIECDQPITPVVVISIVCTMAVILVILSIYLLYNRCKSKGENVLVF